MIICFKKDAYFSSPNRRVDWLYLQPQKCLLSVFMTLALHMHARLMNHSALELIELNGNKMTGSEVFSLDDTSQCIALKTW